MRPSTTSRSRVRLIQVVRLAFIEAAQFDVGEGDAVVAEDGDGGARRAEKEKDAVENKIEELRHRPVGQKLQRKRRLDGEEFFQRIAGLRIETRRTIYPLERANEALDDLRSGRLTGTAVLDLH